MKRILILFVCFIMFATCSHAESLVCENLNGIMIDSQKKSFNKINGKGKVFINILKDKVIVSNDSDKVEYNILKNEQNVIHFSNITPFVFEAYSYYKETGLLYYSKHTDIAGYNYAALYKTKCKITK